MLRTRRTIPTMAKQKTLKITQTRSTIRRSADQKKVMAALGLRGIRQTVEHQDSPQIRGMIVKVNHLVSVESA